MNGSKKVIVTGYVGDVGGFYVQESVNFTQALPGMKVAKEQLNVWINELDVMVVVKRKAAK